MANNIGIQMNRKANQVIYDDFKLKNPLVSMAYTTIFQRYKG